jgi:2-polyprenyl-3-methyl-5-hydroxy-6-metoxy-1,4-benzoquinol methylase
VTEPRCRFCSTALEHTFVDLGMSPVSNAFLTADQLNAMEPFYPLHAQVCGKCFLVQLQEFQSPQQIFQNYAYFSSYSDSWLAHARTYAAQMVTRFGLSAESQVVEIASNDGYLLQYFKERGIPVLGIEPAANVAKAAESRGIPTAVKFFGRQTAHELAAACRRADLLVGNNVLAHVPDLNDFVAGLTTLLKPSGVITMEFPHLLRLMEETQFDTIYHEHFSYFSFTTAERVFSHHGMTLFDVEEIPTHGGSLRIYARHTANTGLAISDRVIALRNRESTAGLSRIETYSGFGDQVQEVKRALLEFMIGARRQGKRIVGYGAAAKGNTLLNYCGIRGDFLDYVVDRSPHKQGRFLPGTHIQIHAPEHIMTTRPDYVLLLPWNIKEEIVVAMAGIKEWGGRFVVAVPELTML